MQITMTSHALRTVADKGINLDDVRAVWNDPDTTYPSHRHPGQHKRIGRGLCLACDDVTGKVITVFVDQVATPLRPDQARDVDAVRWANRNRVR
jgi:hypothetical protein